MKKTIVCILGLVCALSFSTINTQAQEAEIIPNLIVIYDSDVEEPEKEEFRVSFSATVIKTYPALNGELWEISFPVNYVDPDEEDSPPVELTNIFQVQSNSNVKSKVSTDIDLGQSIVVPEMTPAPTQNDLSLYNSVPFCTSASVSTGGGPLNLLVGFIDSGVDYSSHTSVFSPFYTPSSTYAYNAFSSTQAPDDDHGHGTGMAGLACATAISEGYNNFDLWVYKVFDHTGYARISDVIAAIDQAFFDGVDILNMSFSFRAPSNYPYPGALEKAVEQYIQNGGLPICAAGNHGLDLSSYTVYPPNLNVDGMLVVASGECTDDISVWSNYSKNHVQLAAPGEAVLAPDLGSNNWAYHNGTSIATSIVTAAAMLVASHSPNQSFENEEVICALLSGVTKDINLQSKVETSGYINADISSQHIVNYSCGNPPPSLTVPSNNGELIEAESTETPGLEVFPNPFTNELKIHLDAKCSDALNIKLYNTSGQLMFQQKEQVEEGFNAIQMNLSGPSYGEGVYILQLECCDRVINRKLIQQK